MKRKREERRRIRRLKLRTLFMLSLTLIFNTYAWFLYVTTVSTNMTVHVDAWSVDFQVGEETIERELLFEIEHTYPGMDEVVKEVKITNTGEKSAKLTYNVAMLRILDDIYIVENELTEEEKANLSGAETKLTTEEMNKMLSEDFPFKINIETSTDILSAEESALITMSFNWPFDSGNDEIDTKYGMDSYEYYKENVGESAIEIKIKLKAQQSND